MEAEPSEEPPPMDEELDEDEEESDPEYIARSRRCNPKWVHMLEMAIGPVIIANLFFVCYETDLRAYSETEDVEEPFWLLYVNRAFLIIYVLELCVHLQVERWQFHRSAWNLFDAFIVSSGLLGEVMDLAAPSSNFSGGQLLVLRTFRVLRMLRVVRLLNKYKELWLLVRNLVSAMRTLFWSAILFGIMLTIWSILAVEYIHPVMLDVPREECVYCSRAFTSVLRADFTFFQIMSGDDWGNLANAVIDEHPETALIFIPMVFTMVFGMINLVSAVMVENAAQARQDDIQHMAKEQHKKMRKAKEALQLVFESLDTNGSGELSLDELHKGLKASDQFRQILQVLHVKPQEMKYLFAIMDEDNSGGVTAVEFAEKLHYMKTQETRTTLMFLWHHISDLTRKQDQHMALLEALLEQQRLQIGELREGMKPVASVPLTPPVDPRKFRKSVSWSFDHKHVNESSPVSCGASHELGTADCQDHDTDNTSMVPSAWHPSHRSDRTPLVEAAQVPLQRISLDPAERLMALPVENLDGDGDVHTASGVMSVEALTLPRPYNADEWSPDLFKNAGTGEARPSRSTPSSIQPAQRPTR